MHSGIVRRVTRKTNAMGQAVLLQDPDAFLRLSQLA